MDEKHRPLILVAFVVGLGLLALRPALNSLRGDDADTPGFSGDGPTVQEPAGPGSPEGLEDPQDPDPDALAEGETDTADDPQTDPEDPPAALALEPITARSVTVLTTRDVNHAGSAGFEVLDDLVCPLPQLGGLLAVAAEQDDGWLWTLVIRNAPQPVVGMALAEARCASWWDQALVYERQGVIHTLDMDGVETEVGPGRAPTAWSRGVAWVHADDPTVVQRPDLPDLRFAQPVRAMAWSNTGALAVIEGTQLHLLQPKGATQVLEAPGLEDPVWAGQVLIARQGTRLVRIEPGSAKGTVLFEVSDLSPTPPAYNGDALVALGGSTVYVLSPDGADRVEIQSDWDALGWAALRGKVLFVTTERGGRRVLESLDLER